MKKIVALILTFIFSFNLISCTSQFGTQEELVILSGSENKELEGLLNEFTKASGIKVSMVYKGSVDIMYEIKAGASGYDAVWPANSIWISMGDDKGLVKHAQSIMASPVVFGIQKSLAEKLGFVRSDVTVEEILSEVQAGRLDFAMTSATQSNSGACAYLGFLYAMLGKNTPITSADLSREDLRQNIKALLSGVNRSSGSSDWLKDLIVNANPMDNLNAMVNYESLIIAANQELAAKGQEPLYVVYPVDGMSLADSPLGYINHGVEKKEDEFLKLQEFLLSEQSQKKLNDLGRRTGMDLMVQSPNLAVWNEDWGIVTEKQFSFITLPSKDVILEALNLYQSALRKPSATVYCLDYSGSMDGGRNEQMVSALGTIFNQESAARLMLQNSPEDYTAVIAFSDRVLDIREVHGNSSEDMVDLYQWVKELYPEGGTDIYTPATEGIRMLQELDRTYIKAVVLLTDGESNTGMSASGFESWLSQNETSVPVFSIRFGEASDNQLQNIAGQTSARVFDGREDLTQAFRQVRGYN